MISFTSVNDDPERHSLDFYLYMDNPRWQFVETLNIELAYLHMDGILDNLEKLFIAFKGIKSLKSLVFTVYGCYGLSVVQRFLGNIMSFHSHGLQVLRLAFDWLGHDDEPCVHLGSCSDFLISLSNSQLKSFSIDMIYCVEESKVCSALPSSLTVLKLRLRRESVLDFSMITKLRLDILEIDGGHIPMEQLRPLTAVIMNVSSLKLQRVTFPSSNVEDTLLRISLYKLKQFDLEVQKKDCNSLLLLRCAPNLVSLVFRGSVISFGLQIPEMFPNLEHLEISDTQCSRDTAQDLIDSAVVNLRSTILRVEICYSGWNWLKWSSCPSCKLDFADKLETLMKKNLNNAENSQGINSKKRKR
jgi:hypothetical protein